MDGAHGRRDAGFSAPEHEIVQLLLLALATAAGAALLQQQSQLPPMHYGLWSLAAGVAVYILHKSIFRLSRWLSFACLLTAFFLAGFFWASWQAASKLDSELGPAWHGRDVRIEGVISAMTQPDSRGTRFRFDVERVLTVGATIPPRIAMTWYGGWTGAEREVPALRAGQRWQFTARLRPPHGNLNPHGFDIEAWLLERDIRATGYVREQQPARLITAMVWRPGYAVERLRERIRARLSSLLSGKAYAGILTALAVGDQRAISTEQWRVLTRTGTNHLMSISGLHVTLVAGLVFAITLRIWRRSTRLALLVSPLRAATLLGLVAAAVYVALSGFALPAQRAICMLAVIALSLMTGWHAAAPAVLGAALVFVLAVDPMAVHSPGFWLSFTAVAAILMATALRGRSDGPVMQFARVQWTITVALVPVLLVLFHQVSIVSPLANAIAIPMVSLVIAPLALLLVVAPLALVATVAHSAVAVCFAALELLSGLPGAVWQQHAPVLWTIPVAVFGTILLLLPRGFPARWLGLILIVPMLIVRPPKPGPGELWLTLLDVGQGLSAVIRTANHAVLFDAGPDYQGANDAGRRIVMPYLRGEGIRRLDRMIVSHDDVDHAGGADSVIAALAPDQVLTPFATREAGRGWQRVTRCEAGQTWSFDNVRFEILHPPPHKDEAQIIGDNDRSCVLRIDSIYGAVLLPADIERRSEQALLETTHTQLRAEVLVAPHHGSRTSSSPQFVSAVAPEWVLFPVGYSNRYGHPHPLVETRYRDFGAKLLRTDELGAIALRFTANGISLSAWRQEKRRYWHETLK